MKQQYDEPLLNVAFNFNVCRCIEASTPYMYSSYDGNDESAPTDRSKILILGGGPNRIGHGGWLTENKHSTTLNLLPLLRLYGTQAPVS